MGSWIVVGETVMTDPVQDLWPVCPNCHALIHCKGQDEEYTIEESAEGRAVQVEDQPDLGAAHRTVEGAGPGSGKVGVGKSAPDRPMTYPCPVFAPRYMMNSRHWDESS